MDGTQFIPMIISNVTTHHALVLNQRVNQPQIPLQIMISPMHTQAATMGAGLKFVEFLSKRVLALDVKLGPVSSVSIESGGEGAGVQSTSGEGGKATAMVTSPPTSPKKHDSSKTPFTVHTPSTADHTYGTSKTSKTPGTPAKPGTMFSPKATASLAKFMDMSDDNEGTPQKRCGGSANERFLPRKQRSMMTQIAIPPLLPVRATCPKRKLRRGKQRRKCLPPTTRVVTQVLRSGQPPRSPAEMRRPGKSPGQTGIVLANGRKTSSLSISTANKKGCAPRNWLAAPTTLAMSIC